MAFQVSPGVLVQEKDLTRIIPAVSTSTGAFAGEFRKGPLDEVITISSEQELVNTFGKPDSSNFEDFFSAANFLQYSNALRVVRVSNTGLSNATVSGSSFTIKNTTDYQNNYADGSASVGEWAARTAGAHGNNLAVSICPSATAYEEAAKTKVDGTAHSIGDQSIIVDSTSGFNVGDIIEFSTTASGSDYDGRKYRVTTVDSATQLSFVRADEGTGGLHTAPANNSNTKKK